MRFPRRLMLRFLPAGARRVHQRRDAQLLDQASRGTAYFLGPDQDTGALAQAALVQRQSLRSISVKSSAQLPHGTVRKTLATALEHGSCLLALPFNTAAIQLMRDLANDARMPLILVESAALRTVLEEIPLADRSLPRCSTQDVIGHVKAAANSDAPLLYVSFPELHALGTGTTAPVTFLDKPCRFSLLEPLLCRHSINTLLTIGHAAAGPDAGLHLVAWDAAACRVADPAGAMRSTLEWLCAQLAAVAAAMPAHTLSWPQLYRASLHCRQIERNDQLKQLEAYFLMWKQARGGLLDHTHQFAMARIAAMRDAA